ncbi:MAG: hypothetical protein AAF688_12195 [Bacteroidota bacterium]
MNKENKISLYPAICILEASAFNMEAENYNPNVDEDKKTLNAYSLKSIDRALEMLRKEHRKVVAK